MATCVYCDVCGQETNSYDTITISRGNGSVSYIIKKQICHECIKDEPTISRCLSGIKQGHENWIARSICKFVYNNIGRR